MLFFMRPPFSLCTCCPHGLYKSISQGIFTDLGTKESEFLSEFSVYYLLNYMAYILKRCVYFVCIYKMYRCVQSMYIQYACIYRMYRCVQPRVPHMFIQTRICVQLSMCSRVCKNMYLTDFKAGYKICDYSTLNFPKLVRD